MEFNENKTLYEFIDYELLLQGLSMRQAALQMGVSPNILYSTKTRLPSRQTLRKISLFLGCTILDLVSKPITHEDADKK